MNDGFNLWRRLWPAVPADVRDDLAMLRIARLRAQVPTLYVTLMLVVLTTRSATDVQSSIWTGTVLPLGIVLFSLMRLIWWMQHRREAETPEGARRMVRRTVWIGTMLCLVASSWTALVWWQSPLDQRTYFPLFMSIGALAAGFCLSSVRFATLAVLVTGIGPMLAVLLALGNRMDRLAIAVILLASAFLIRMIWQQHALLVDLLRLQRHTAQQAATDPLTALCNRRALYMELERTLTQPAGTGLVLLDLDRFKPVNDAHGHATGDRLLIAVADILRDACPAGACAFRLGGDEFALVTNTPDREKTSALVTRILASLARPFDIDGHRITIGASAGIAHSRPADTIDSLIARADRRLYAAKDMRDAGAVAGRPVAVARGG